MLVVFLTVSPQSVRIQTATRHKVFQVGQEYRLICIAEGSRPPPKITWSLGQEIMQPFKVHLTFPYVKPAQFEIFQQKQVLFCKYISGAYNRGN